MATLGISPYNGTFPFCVSNKSSLLQKPRFSLAAKLSVNRNQLENTSFLGKSLSFEGKIESLGKLRKTRFPISPIRAAVKRRKEVSFDNVIQREKKLNLVLRIRKLLMSQPNRIMALDELGRYRRALGLQGKRRCIALLKKFPAVFEVLREGAYSLEFKLTPEAERLYLEEMRARNGTDDLSIIKLRKLLMMSADKRILLEKIGHMQADLGLPSKFRSTICRRYPEYFKVVRTRGGPALELTHWDPELAVSAAELAEEENRQQELEERNLVVDRVPRFSRAKLPKFLNVSKSDMRRICQFRDMPYISPYSDFSKLRRGSREKEKHACAVVHELLSLTVEKRTLVDRLTHFRDEFRFSQQLRGMLIRHPDMFYVSVKGMRDTVFLREAYHNSYLLEKDRLFLIKEKMHSLVSVSRLERRRTEKRDADGLEGTKPEDEGSEKEGEELSDIDYLMNDGFDEDDEDYEDDEDSEDEWSDEGDDDLPPDFYEDDEETINVEHVKTSRNVDDPKKKVKKVLVPVFPNGRPRERW